MGKRETRTQEALVAALRARPRTPYRTVQCVLGAKASIFSSLTGSVVPGRGAEDGDCVEPPRAARHLYVHVPFCRSRCAYCDFASEPFGPHDRAGRVAAYVVALRAELERESPWLALPLETAYVGGGTPTTLPPDLLFPLVRSVARLTRPGGEVTVETTPTTADERTLAGLREAGATRLSMGIQSFAPALRRALGRRCTDAELDLALAAVRDSGFEEWNVDLIFGIPGQSWEQAQADLEAAAAVHPTHISAV